MQNEESIKKLEDPEFKPASMTEANINHGDPIGYALMDSILRRLAELEKKGEITHEQRNQP